MLQAAPRTMARRASVSEQTKSGVVKAKGRPAGRVSASRTRSIAFCALSIAVMAACAWVTVPFGPVPFTLQTFAVAFAVLALRPKEALASIAGYLLLGAVGLPVFSGMRGGIGMLAGPTGGFLWGFLLGAVAALGILRLCRPLTARGRAGQLAANVAALIAFMLVTYVVGWAQLMAVSGMGPLQAFAVAVAPFVVIDACKMVVAALVAQAVKRAVG